MSSAVEKYRLLIADVYELAGASRATGEAMARAEGSTVARWHVLSVLSVGEWTVPGVARRLGLSRQAVQRVVNDLATDRMVTIVDNPGDRRSPHVRLTAKGRRTQDRLFDRSEAQRAEVLRRAGVSAADLDRSRRVLQALTQALSEADRPDREC